MQFGFAGVQRIKLITDSHFFLYGFDFKSQSGSFGFSEESLKKKMFWSLVLGLRTEENRFSELRDDSDESTEFRRFSPSLTEFYRVSNRYTPSLVSGIGIDAVRPESVTNRPIRTGLGRFFKPYLSYDHQPLASPFVGCPIWPCNET